MSQLSVKAVLSLDDQTLANSPTPLQGVIGGVAGGRGEGGEGGMKVLKI